MADDDDAAPTRPEPRLAGLMWGAAKTGKTTYACSSPGKKFLINCDPEGYVAVDYRDDVEVWDYSGEEPHRVVQAFTTTLGTKIERAISKGDTVIFDSITMFNQMALWTAIKNGVGASNKFTPSIETPGLAAYGARTQYLINTMHPILRATRRVGAHCWFIAHEDTPERNDKGEFLYQSILMSENAINQTSASISEIWYVRVVDGQGARLISVRPHSLRKPMGSRMFHMDQAAEFNPKYRLDKPDLQQPNSIASIWKRYIDGGRQKMDVPT